MRIAAIIITVIVISFVIFMLQPDNTTVETENQTINETYLPNPYCIKTLNSIMPENITLYSKPNETSWFYDKKDNPQIPFNLSCTFISNIIESGLFNLFCSFSHRTETYQNQEGQVVGRVEFQGAITKLTPSLSTDRKRLGSSSITLREFTINTTIIKRCEWPEGLSTRQVFPFTVERVQKMCKQDCEDFCSLEGNETSEPIYNIETGDCRCICS